MSAIENAQNPCLSCTVGQDCCTRLTGLLVTENEFEQCFSQHGDNIEVTREGRFYVINESKPAKCPNWRNNGCAVYEERPFECRLFPHNSYVRHHSASKISIAFHEVHSCPMVHELKMPEEEARSAVEAFAKAVYTDGEYLEVTAETVSDTVRRKFVHLLLKVLRGVSRLRSGSSSKIGDTGRNR